jgi:Taurine catabolism dioxygenase TauD, TfdA family
MTYVHRALIDHPSAWTNESLGGKQGLIYPMEPKHLDALDEVLTKTAHKEPLEVTREEFDHPIVNPMLAAVRDIVQNGRGAVIVSGITRERYSEEAFERLYWGFGLHLGVPVSQSYRGDRLGRVTQTAVGPNNPINRGYKGAGELNPHTDNNVEVVGLMSVQKAAEGGYSLLASSTAIHNVLVTDYPDLLDALYEGYYMASEEAALSVKPVSDFKIPVYCYVDGRLSCLFNRGFYERANRARGDMPPVFDEATKVIAALSRRPDIQVRYILEPGEMMFINNYTTLHARTPFTDSPELKRSLLRLWIKVPDGRPVSEPYRRKAAGYKPGTEQTPAAAVAG